MRIKNLLELKQKKFLIGTILWLVILTYLSFANPNTLPKVSVSNSDKIAHFGVYFILTTLWACYFFYEKNKTTYKAIFRSGILAFFYGLFVEVMQSVLTSFRTADYLDALANTFGIVIACILCTLLFKKLKS